MITIKTILGKNENAGKVFYQGFHTGPGDDGKLCQVPFGDISDKPQDAVRSVINWLRRNDKPALADNLKTLSDWAAIAIVLGADEANRIINDFKNTF